MLKTHRFLITSILTIALIGGGALARRKKISAAVQHCFADVIVLRLRTNLPHADLPVVNGRFVVNRHVLPSRQNFRDAMAANTLIGLELWHCVQRVRRPTLGERIAAFTQRGTDSERAVKILLDIYLQLWVDAHGEHKSLAVSEGLQGKLENAQCFLDTMILEGRQKMGSPEAGIRRMDGQIVHEMFHGQIAISRDGAEYLGQCVQQNKGWVLRIGPEQEGQQNGRHKISLADPNDRMHFMGGILRIPPSPGVVRRITHEFHCLTSVLLDKFLVHSSLMIAAGHGIHRRLELNENVPKIVWPMHQELYHHLRGCIFRREVFLKKRVDDHNDGHMVVDVGAIFGQGLVLVERGKKEMLDKQQDCLVEFLHEKYGLKYFEKVVDLKEHDELIEQAFIKHRFNSDASIKDQFMLRLDIGQRPKNVNWIYTEGSAEFAELIKCGVQMAAPKTTKFGHNGTFAAIDIGQLLDLYTPNELFLPTEKVSFEQFIRREKFVTTANADELANGDELGELLCQCNHSFHYECVHEWISPSRTTCPKCRADIVKMETVVKYERANANVREGEEEWHDAVQEQ